MLRPHPHTYIFRAANTLQFTSGMSTRWQTVFSCYPWKSNLMKPAFISLPILIICSGSRVGAGHDGSLSQLKGRGLNFLIMRIRWKKGWLGRTGHQGLLGLSATDAFLDTKKNTGWHWNSNTHWNILTLRFWKSWEFDERNADWAELATKDSSKIVFVCHQHLI